MINHISLPAPEILIIRRWPLEDSGAMICNLGTRIPAKDYLPAPSPLIRIITHDSSVKEDRKKMPLYRTCRRAVAVQDQITPEPTAHANDICPPDLAASDREYAVISMA